MCRSKINGILCCCSRLIPNLPSGKTTDRKCLECTMTYRLHHEERDLSIPAAAGGRGCAQQTANISVAGCPKLSGERAKHPHPPQFILLCAPLEYGEGGIKPSPPSLWCCLDHKVFSSLCCGQRGVGSSVRVLSFSPVSCSTWTCVAWNQKDRGMQREGESGLHLNPPEA